MPQLTPATAVLLAAATAVVALLVFDRPVTNRETVLAALPWLVTAAPLHALRGHVAYPAAVEDALATPWVFLLVGTLWGGTWLLLAQLTTGDGAHRRVPRYLALVGIGTALAPFTVLVTTYAAGAPTQRLFAWAATPVLACLVTYVALVAMGLWLPRAASFAGLAGGLLLFGVALHAVVATLSLSFGGWSPSPLLVDLGQRVAILLEVPLPLALAWITIWSRMVVAVLTIAALATAARWRIDVGERGLDAATLISVVVGSNTFVLALTSGVIA